jgi:hypothetical protein
LFSPDWNGSLWERNEIKTFCKKATSGSFFTKFSFYLFMSTTIMESWKELQIKKPITNAIGFKIDFYVFLFI